MGSKTNKDTGDVECELCDRKFHNLQALRSHKSAKHNKEKGEIIEAKPAVISRVSKRLQMKKESDGEAENSENDNITCKTEFACPICEPRKFFATNFQAVRHIQRKHNVENSAMTLEVLKPVPVEMAFVEKPPTNNCNVYTCLGCENSFSSVPLFNNHVVAHHRDNLDNMFFKSPEEFSMWQQKMQNQVRIKYVPLNPQGIRKHFQCNFVSPRNECNKTYLCPSAVVSKQIANGIQVRYSMDHFGHECPEYECPKEFTQYLTNKITNVSAATSLFDELIGKKDPDVELYTKLTNLLKSIIDEAATLSPSYLRKLFNAALELQAVLNSFDDSEDKEPLISKNMTDDQITNVLEGQRDHVPETIVKTEKTKDPVNDALEGKRVSARLKRKIDTSTHAEVKKKKGDDENDKTKENTELSSPKVPVKSSSLMSPTFVDSYRQFVDTTLQVAKTGPTKTPRKEVLKTKIGQFIPSPERKYKKIDKESAESLLVPIKSESLTKVQSKKPTTVKPAKKALKSIGNDIKYEVIEQENDCNILVLKI